MSPKLLYFELHRGKGFLDHSLALVSGGFPYRGKEGHGGARGTPQPAECLAFIHSIKLKTSTCEWLHFGMRARVESCYNFCFGRESRMLGGARASHMCCCSFYPTRLCTPFEIGLD